MAGLLFQFNKQDNAILNPDAIKLVPGLKNLKPAELLYIILSYDYSSPFHQLDESERTRRAVRQAFGTEDAEKIISSKKVLDAIEDYKSLQFNVDKENQLTYQAKIAQLRMQLYEATEAKRIRDISETIKYLTDEIDKVQDKIDTDNAATYTSGGKKISFLEQWAVNQRAFKANKTQKQLYDQQKKQKEGIVKISLTE